MKIDRTLVQQAARKLRGQGIKNVELVGEEWDLEFCWAFYQGFYTAKQDYGIEFPHLDHDLQDELLARIECGDFVRGIINEPAQSLTPVKLAERAAEFILNQADIYNEKVRSVLRLFLVRNLSNKVITEFGLWVKALLTCQLCCNLISIQHKIRMRQC